MATWKTNILNAQTLHLLPYPPPTSSSASKRQCKSFKSPTISHLPTVFSTASEWTSTVLATLLIDYSQVTNDSQYFPNFVAVFNNESVFDLIFQANDDRLWVCLFCLRGAAYASINYPQWVQPFLDRAQLFYTLASTSWDNTTCGGGMFWGQGSTYKNAVTNELWITASVEMYEAFGDPSLLETSLQAWTWFNNSGMINPQGLVNDGLASNCT